MKTPTEMGAEWAAQKDMEDRRRRREALLAATRLDPQRYSNQYQPTN